MKRSFRMIFGILAFSACVSAMAITADEIVDKMQKAHDPEGKAKNVKTSLMKVNVTIPMQRIKMSVTQKFREPDQQITTTELPGVLKVIQVFDGKNGWEISSLAGKRLIKDKELDFLKFSTAISSIRNEFKDIFAKAELGEDTVVEGVECYQLIMTPKKEFNRDPMKCYVDKKTFLTRKTEMTLVGEQGEMPGVTIMEDYKSFDGILLPAKVTMEAAGLKMVQTVEKFDIDVKIEDSEFKMPGSLTAPAPATEAK